jgi:ribosomal protein L18E
VPIDDRELWSCALAVERRYGARAPMHVAERIGALVLEDDAEGVEVWKAIAARLDRLRQQRPAE